MLVEGLMVLSYAQEEFLRTTEVERAGEGIIDNGRGEVFLVR